MKNKVNKIKNWINGLNRLAKSKEWISKLGYKSEKKTTTPEAI